jgi:hypothetical protein
MSHPAIVSYQQVIILTPALPSTPVTASCGGRGVRLHR